MLLPVNRPKADQLERQPLVPILRSSFFAIIPKSKVENYSKIKIVCCKGLGDDLIFFLKFCIGQNGVCTPKYFLFFWSSSLLIQ